MNVIFLFQTIFFSSKNYISAESDFYNFAVLLDNSNLRIYEDNSPIKEVILQDKSFKLDFDLESNLMTGSSSNRRVFVMNLNNQTTKWSVEENDDAKAFAFLNKTHFIAGFKEFFIIYDCSNLNNRFKMTDSTYINEVNDIKILYHEQKILIASRDGFISIFDLTTLSFLSKFFTAASNIYDIDAFDKNLIVSQCNDRDICHYNLDSVYQFNHIVKLSENQEIFVIKIMNENQVIFGGDWILKIWDISINQIIKTFLINEKVFSLEIFSNEIIASGDDKGYIRFWNTINGTNFKNINTFSNINYIKNLNGYSPLINYLNSKILDYSSKSELISSLQPLNLSIINNEKDTTVQTAYIDKKKLTYQTEEKKISSGGNNQILSEISTKYSIENVDENLSLSTLKSETSKLLTTYQYSVKDISIEENVSSHKTSIDWLWNSYNQNTNKVKSDATIENLQNKDFHLSTLQLIIQNQKSTNSKDHTVNSVTISKYIANDLYSSKYIKMQVDKTISESFNQFLLFQGFMSKMKCFKQCFILSCNFVVFNEMITKCQLFLFEDNILDFIQSPGYSVYFKKD